MPPSRNGFFNPGKTVFRGIAPGRLDVMGGFGDYSGSLVLQMPLALRTEVSLARRDDKTVRVFSSEAKGLGLEEEVVCSLDSLIQRLDAGNFEEIGQRLGKNPKRAWAAYCLGCLSVLASERDFEPSGLDIHIRSDVPLGKGLSSSAALEVATLMAMSRAFDLKFSGNEIPLLAQRVENKVVGAPCGLMDQLVSYHGEANSLTPILCQPDCVRRAVPLPEGIELVAIDTGVSRSIGGEAYARVRTATFMGYSIIAWMEGARVEDLRETRETGDSSSLPYRGYLANITPSRYEQKYRQRIPDTLGSEDFARLAGCSIDPVTRPREDTIYDTGPAVRHPIEENGRAETALGLLEELNENPDRRRRTETLETFGELMYRAHDSYNACRLGCEQTDAIVEAIRVRGPESGVYGAKPTGGGAGGMVCVLCEGAKGVATAREVAREIARGFGHAPLTIEGSGDGAFKLGTRAD